MLQQQEKPTKALRRFNAVGPCANVFASSNTGSWRLERPKVDYSACIRCGICQRSCPADVVTVHKEGTETVTFDWDYCKGCGICANECPCGAIDMTREDI